MHTEFAYDGFNRLSRVWRPDGTGARYRFDSLGRQDIVESLGVSGTVLQATDVAWGSVAPTSVTHRFAENTEGAVAVWRESTQTIVERDGAGRPIVTQWSDGRNECATYNSVGEVGASWSSTGAASWQLAGRTSTGASVSVSGQAAYTSLDCGEEGDDGTLLSTNVSVAVTARGQPQTVVA